MHLNDQSLPKDALNIGGPASRPSGEQRRSTWASKRGAKSKQRGGKPGGAQRGRAVAQGRSYAEVASSSRADIAEAVRAQEVKEKCAELKAMLWAATQDRMQLCRPFVVSRALYESREAALKKCEERGAGRFWVSYVLTVDSFDKSDMTMLNCKALDMAAPVDLMHAKGLVEKANLSLYLYNEDEGAYDIFLRANRPRGIACVQKGGKYLWSPVERVRTVEPRKQGLLPEAPTPKPAAEKGRVVKPEAVHEEPGLLTLPSEPNPAEGELLLSEERARAALEDHEDNQFWCLEVLLRSPVAPRCAEPEEEEEEVEDFELLHACFGIPPRFVELEPYVGPPPSLYAEQPVVDRWETISEPDMDDGRLMEVCLGDDGWQHIPQVDLSVGWEMVGPGVYIIHKGSILERARRFVLAREAAESWSVSRLEGPSEVMRSLLDTVCTPLPLGPWEPPLSEDVDPWEEVVDNPEEPEDVPSDPEGYSAWRIAHEGDYQILGNVRVVRGDTLPPADCTQVEWVRPHAGLAGHKRAVARIEGPVDRLLPGWGARERVLSKFFRGRIMHEMSDSLIGFPICDGALVYSRVECDHPTEIGKYQNGCYDHTLVSTICCDGATYTLEPLAVREYHVQVSRLRKTVSKLPLWGVRTPWILERLVDRMKPVLSIGLRHEELYTRTEALDELPNDISRVRTATAMVLPLVDPALHGIIHDIKMEIIGAGCEADPLKAVRQVVELGRAINRAKGPTQFSLK